ncbi:unnamed protein product [Bemisia tabaci]|uniref:Uncharacterized protein n=1 Tax=Bemisia tabaci TaxID=7038 RepID=A0A9P0A1V7_BEMTA|nr:unnamed protein product [Bemisia tabaci]
MAGGEIQTAPQSPSSQGSPFFRQTDPTDEDQTYEPQIHGPKPCRNKKPTPQDNKFCQDDCDHKYSTPPRQVGTASWTVGKCKGKKCKCTFNYAAYGKWIKLKDRVTTMGDPNKLKKLVMKRCNREAKGGSSGVVDESTTLERFDLD